MVSVHGMFGLRSWLSMIFGLLLFVIGGLPILNGLGVLDFALPGLPDFIVRIIVLGAGVLLLWDAQHEIFTGRAWMWLSIVFGIPIFILGLIPVLNGFGVIGFSLEFIPSMIYNVLTGLAGIVLFIDAWKSEG